MNISIFGLGYVGSVSSACFSLMGHQVIGVDVKKEKNDCINSGKAPIFEKDLNSLLEKVVNSKGLYATHKVDYAIKNSELSIICVGTPSLSDGSVDLSYILKVCKEIASSLKLKTKYHVVVIRSTIPPGTIENKIVPLFEEISGKKVGKDFGLAMNPEFLREGSAIDDFYNPERIIIGATDERSIDALTEVYKSTTDYKVDAPIYPVPIKLAEMCKYVDNTFHALKVVFANEIGVIAKNLDVEGLELMRIFCEDKKLNLSPYYFKPGFSFGGSCLPKDLKGLNEIALKLGIQVPIISSIMSSNEKHTERAVELIKSKKDKSLGFLGLSFKQGTDDIRQNPIIEVIDELSSDKSYTIYLHDNLADLSNLFQKDNIIVKRNVEDIMTEVDLIVLSNNSKEYESILFECSKVVIDLNKSLPNDFETIGLV